MNKATTGKKYSEQDYYEDYWSNANKGEALFEGVPTWGEVSQLEKVTEFFKQALKGKVLDAGCGSGIVTLFLGKYKEISKIVGLDISKTAVGIANKKALEMKLKKVSFVQGSVTDFPLADKTFDTIISFEVIEHIIDVKKMLLECNRVLRTRGFLAISTVELSFVKRILISIFFFESYFSPETPHIRFFTKNTLKRALNETGFEVVDYGWTNSYFGLIPMGQMVLARKKKSL